MHTPAAYFSFSPDRLRQVDRFFETMREFNSIRPHQGLVYGNFARHRHLTQSTNPGQPRHHHCDHFLYQRGYPAQSNGKHHPESAYLNALRPHYDRVFATQIVSQKRDRAVILEVMPRQKLDPKHVRDFFHEHAVSTRLITLMLDLVWKLIAGGFYHLSISVWRLIESYLPVKLKINEDVRKLHTFIVGRTGVGKSVLLHHLIRHYQTKNRYPALVVLDPHGDLADFVAQDKTQLKRDRLVYFEFKGLNRRYIHFNPFDLANPTEDQLNRAQIQFAGAVEQIIGEDFSPRQRTLIRACMGIMLHKPNTTLLDLVRLLQDGQNTDLLRYGQEQLPNVVDRQFFAHSFSQPDYRATKHALLARLIDIVRDPSVRLFTCETSTINLGKLLDGGKIIVLRFDPSKQSADTIRTIGQLVNAAIFSHVIGRPSSKRRPIHVFIDECQYFVCPTVSDILGEARKFGLYLTLATQRVERLSPALQDAILGNVGTLWIGGSRHVTAEKMAKETDVSADQIRLLRRLEFFHVTDSGPTRRQRVVFLGDRHAMKKRQWGQVLKHQAKRFYRAISAQTSPSTQAAAPRSWEPPSL